MSQTTKYTVDFLTKSASTLKQKKRGGKKIYAKKGRLRSAKNGGSFASKKIFWVSERE